MNNFSILALVAAASSVILPACNSVNVVRLAKPEPGQARVVHGVMSRRSAFDWNTEAVTYCNGKPTPNNFWRWSTEQSFDLPPGQHQLTITASANPGGLSGVKEWEGTVSAQVEAGKSYIPKARLAGDFGKVWLEDFSTHRRVTSEGSGVAKFPKPASGYYVPIVIVQ